MYQAFAYDQEYTKQREKRPAFLSKIIMKKQARIVRFLNELKKQFYFLARMVGFLDDLKKEKSFALQTRMVLDE